MKHFLLYAVMASAALINGQAAAVTDTAVITITGTVKDNTCTLEDDKPVFQLPDASVRELSGKVGKRGATIDIPVTLTGCGADAGSVEVTPTGTTDPDVSALWANLNDVDSGGASGVGLRLFKSDGNTPFYPGGSRSETLALTPSQDNVITLHGAMETSKDTVTAGTFQTVITLAIVYK